MSEPRAGTCEATIAAVVQKLLHDHSIERSFHPDDNLRDVGLTSLDMAGLVLAVEAAFDIMIPERDITPANFRSVATITAVVTALTPPLALSA